MPYTHDFARNLAAVQAIAPQATITATTTSAAIDLLDAVEGSIFVLVNAGVIATADSTNYFEFKVTEGATNAAADAVASTCYDPVASWDRLLNATTEGSATYKMNIRPTKRWIKIVMAEEGTASAFATATVFYLKRSGVASA